MSEKPGLESHSSLIYSKQASDGEYEAKSLSEEVLKDVFGRFADAQGEIGRDDFASILLKELELDLQRIEVERIWVSVDVLSLTQRINFALFRHAVRERKILRHVLSVYQSKFRFKVPGDYDYSKPSHLNYKLDSLEFWGDFVEIRKVLDYKWHNNFVRTRQLWQDDVIKNVVVRHEPQPRPWIVYTCGPMGAGKGYALNWMSEQGFFPIENIVHIDPDHFKYVMPEWREYVLRDSEKAGGLTHKESGYMQEVAQEVALSMFQNLWVDGSLRDGQWFSGVFDGIRSRFPQYRIAIFYVFASETTVRARIKNRSESTGRSVPEELIKQSLEAPDRSLGILTSKCDFVARICSESRVPVLTAFEYIDHSGNWNILKKRFGSTSPSPSEFPQSLSPLFIMRTQLSEKHILLNTDDRIRISNYSSKDPSVLKLNLENIRVDACKEIRELIGILNSECTMALSPSHPVNLDEESRALALIPSEAHYFCWVYPIPGIAQSVLENRIVSMKTAEITLILLGGFAYFNLNDEIIAINCIGGVSSNHLLQFGPAQPLPRGALVSLKVRVQPVTLPHMRKKGARYFAWIVPGEKLGDLRVCKYGGFAYIFHEIDSKDEADLSKNCVFPIISA